MNRPEHADFWLIAEVVQDLDDAADDVGLNRTVDVDGDSLVYAAWQRALRMRSIVTEKEEHKLAAAWIDGFATGLNFQRRRDQNSS